MAAEPLGQPHLWEGLERDETKAVTEMGWHGMGATWLIGQGASMAAEPWEQQHRWVGLKGKRQWQQQQNWDGMGRGPHG